MIKARHLAKRYGTTVAVDEASFAVAGVPRCRSGSHLVHRDYLP
jgi:hypothetical protein